jgi:hypothetical protein
MKAQNNILQLNWKLYVKQITKLFISWFESAFNMSYFK